MAAAALCARLMERGALLGSEIVATAIGRVRNEPGLRELIEWIEAAPPGLFESQQIQYLVVALTQTHRDAASEDCRHIHSRFSSTRGRIREPYLRSFLGEFIRAHAHELGTQGGLNSACCTAATALCAGEITPDEVGSVLRLYEADLGPLARQYLLDGMSFAAGGELRDWALTELEHRSWTTPQELAGKTTLAVTDFERGDGVLADLLRTLGPDEVAVMLHAVQYGRRVAGPTVETGRAVLDLVTSPSQPASVREAAVQAYAAFVLDSPQSPGVVAALRAVVADASIPPSIRASWLRVVRWVREEELEALVAFLANHPLEGADRERALHDLLEDSTSTCAKWTGNERACCCRTRRCYRCRRSDAKTPPPSPDASAAGPLTDPPPHAVAPRRRGAEQDFSRTTGRAPRSCRSRPLSFCHLARGGTLGRSIDL